MREMDRRLQRPYPPVRSSSGIAWLALFFSFLALLMSGATLLMTWHDGQLLRDGQGLVDNLRAKLPFKSLSRPNVSAPTPPTPDRGTQTNGETQWDTVREKLHRAENMILSRDGRAREYMDGLKDEIDRLSQSASENGARWLGEASARLKSIREQVAVNGPEAARRLRELTTDFQEKARAFQRVSNALRALTPATPAATATPGDSATPLDDPSAGRESQP